MHYLRSLLPACLNAALLAACSASNNGLSSGPMSVAASITGSRSVTARSELYRAVAGANLYVANCAAGCGGKGKGTVTVYAQGKTKVLRTISKGVVYPFALAFDGNRNLYVANCVAVSATVTEVAL